MYLKKGKELSRLILSPQNVTTVFSINPIRGALSISDARG